MPIEGKIRVGHDITTLKVNLYYEDKGKWTVASRLQMHTFEVILKAKKANGGPPAWLAESVLAYDPQPYNIKRTAESLAVEMKKLCELRLGTHVRGLTKLMVLQSYL